MNSQNKPLQHKPNHFQLVCPLSHRTILHTCLQVETLICTIDPLQLFQKPYLKPPLDILSTVEYIINLLNEVYAVASQTMSRSQIVYSLTMLNTLISIHNYLRQIQYSLVQPHPSNQ